MPGDELVPRPAFNAGRAITIRARPEEIWPWIVQIGFGRAGFYSYDLLDNLGRRSAERIIPALQDLAVGDWVPMASRVSEETAFRVEAFQPTRWMLWTKAASTWAWSLRPVDEQHTRVVTRLRAAYRWTCPMILSDLVLMEVADFHDAQAAAQPGLAGRAIGERRRTRRQPRAGCWRGGRQATSRRHRLLGVAGPTRGAQPPVDPAHRRG